MSNSKSFWKCGVAVFSLQLWTDGCDTPGFEKSIPTITIYEDGGRELHLAPTSARVILGGHLGLLGQPLVVK